MRVDCLAQEHNVTPREENSFVPCSENTDGSFRVFNIAFLVFSTFLLCYYNFLKKLSVDHRADSLSVASHELLSHHPSRVTMFSKEKAGDESGLLELRVSISRGA